jgi:Protein of unknown function (DUF2924)
MAARRPRAEVAMIGDRRLAQQPPAGLDTMIAALGDNDVEQLRLQWRNHFGGTAPSHLPRGLLLRMLVYRVQAAAFGDLDKGILRLLRQSKDESVAGRPFETRGPTTREGVGLKSGALLVREWNGRLERVMILDKGFAWTKPICDRQLRAPSGRACSDKSLPERRGCSACVSNRQFRGSLRPPALPRPSQRPSICR